MVENNREPNFTIDQIFKRKSLLAQLFVVMLMGVAYQEMIAPVRESIRMQGFSFALIILFAVFFLTSLRFFIGAQLHLVDESLLRMRSGVWFFDFFFIVLEMVVFIFLGGVTSVASSKSARFDFIQLIMLIYSIDTVWIVLQFLIGKLASSWKRSLIRWKWAAVNIVSLLIIAPVYHCSSDPFAGIGLGIFGIINLGAFIFDVFVIDYFEVV